MKDPKKSNEAAPNTYYKTTGPSSSLEQTHEPFILPFK